MQKKTLGIFSLTACEGCMWMLLNLGDNFVKILDKFDVLHFPLMQANNNLGPFDIALVEGAVTTEKEKKKVKDIRKRAKFLIAYGTCATYGGVPSIKNFLDLQEVEQEVYENPAVISSIKATGIADFVKVDYFMQGCPVEKNEIFSVLKDLLAGKTPKSCEDPVCVECRKNKNVCLLQLGQPCMGPITYGGCNALCPGHSIACYGCRGPLQDANIDEQVKLFKHHGIKMKDINRYFRKFAGTSKMFKKYIKGEK